MAVESHDKKLDDLLKMVEEGKAQLPDFQRSWVWDDTKISSKCFRPVMNILYPE